VHVLDKNIRFTNTCSCLTAQLLCLVWHLLCNLTSVPEDMSVSISKYESEQPIVVDPGQTARVCRLAWLKTRAKALYYSD